MSVVIVYNVGGIISDIMLCPLFTVSHIGCGNGHSLSEFCGKSYGTVTLLTLLSMFGPLGE